jgi:AraC-like DNA-binding protein
MRVIHFHAPPLPHYINSGYSLANPGRKHPERYAVGEFDLLVVMQGCLYLGEEDRQYELSEGHALILHPELHHYPTEGCRVETASFWLHFQTEGEWRVLEQASGSEENGADGSETSTERSISGVSFDIRLPQFTRLLQPTKMYDLLRQLNDLETQSHRAVVKWKQQRLFQEVLSLLSASMETSSVHAGAEVADRAASFLRLHYRGEISTRDLGQALNFHPIYIARCMQREFGCSPMEYLMQYRLEQAKRLLLQTDLPIARIAEEVGFQQPAYFASCFGKHEGLTPRQYRQRFSGQR